jgi:putative acetyltransferase
MWVCKWSEVDVTLVRDEEPADVAQIRGVHLAAFPGAEEARLVDALRAAGQLSISLVAVESLTIVGHIGFSPVQILAPSGLAVGLGLAPVAVLPSRQRRGVGSALVRAGLERCKRHGAPFVVVLGDPGYYQRFGFAPSIRWGVGNEYGVADEFMALELAPGGIPSPAGVARYAPQFGLVG